MALVSLAATPADILALPWAGNHASDSGLFRAVTAVVHARARSDRPGACALLQAMSAAGMGIDAPVSDADLSVFLSGD